MRKVLAIGGVPGTGKTSLIREFMKTREWVVAKPVKLLDSHWCEKSNLMLFGKYEGDEVFAGTDKLSMGCQPEAIKYVQQSDTNILFEGDRLFTSSFLNILSETAGVELMILVLTCNNKLLKDRYEERGSNQPEIFLKAKRTKISNILNSFELSDYTKVMKNETIGEQTLVLDSIEEFYAN